jgi:hypothetical protein
LYYWQDHFYIPHKVNFHFCIWDIVPTILSHHQKNILNNRIECLRINPNYSQDYYNKIIYDIKVDDLSSFYEWVKQYIYFNDAVYDLYVHKFKFNNNGEPYDKPELINFVNQNL